MPLSALGAVLAGGGSRRMGRAKGELDLLGRPLAARAAEVLGNVFPDVVLVAPPRPAYLELGLEVIPDLHSGCGPLGGLHAALHHAAGRPVFVLACDLPLVSAELVRYVLEYETPSPTLGPRGLRAVAKVTIAERRLQPLCGLYSPGCLEVADRHLRNGALSLQSLLDAVETIAVPMTAELPFFHRQMLLNVNWPEDLETARSLAEAGTRSR